MLRFSCFSLALFLAAFSGFSIAADQPVYEMRTYTCAPGKLEALQTRFRDHTCRLFEKHGMRNIAYWTPTDGDNAANTLIYVLEHKSRDAAKASWAAFRSDPDWKAVAAKSEADHGKILAKAPESVYMATTDYSPDVGPVDPKLLYELRVYVTNEGKLDALQARFRDHTCGLFRKHGIQNVAYWMPLDKPASANTLIYIVAHSDRESAQANFKAFGSDPDWQTARRASEAEGPLLSSRPQSTFMRTTDFSPLPAK
ncbi:MAG: NIPSNAP family protein [Planctomycetaceae bacterium]